MTTFCHNSSFLKPDYTANRMFLKVVIYRNVAFTHRHTQKGVTEVKRKHAIYLGMGL